MRWLAGLAATAAFSGMGYVFTAARDVDLQVQTLRHEMVDLQRRVERIDGDLATNRLTRMAPETRVEIDGLRRELDAMWRRVQMLEDQTSKRR